MYTIWQPCFYIIATICMSIKMKWTTLSVILAFMTSMRFRAIRHPPVSSCKQSSDGFFVKFWTRGNLSSQSLSWSGRRSASTRTRWTKRPRGRPRPWPWQWSKENLLSTIPCEQGPMLWSLKYFRRKIWQKIWRSWFKIQLIFEKMHHSIGF
jgi:hypothetical protein